MPPITSIPSGKFSSCSNKAGKISQGTQTCCIATFNFALVLRQKLSYFIIAMLSTLDMNRVAKCDKHVTFLSHVPLDPG